MDRYQASGGLSVAAPFDQPFFIALTQALGIGTDSYSSLTQLPATTSIQYVRAWKLVNVSAQPAAAPGTQPPPPLSSRAPRARIEHVAERSRRWRPRRGTTFELTVSRAARARLIFSRLEPGRVRRGRCVRAVGKRAAGRRCLRAVGVGELGGIRVRRGANEIHFHGRLAHGRRLKPGRYRATIIVGAARSRPLSFTILPGRPFRRPRARRRRR